MSFVDATNAGTAVMSNRKARIAEAFSMGARTYDDAATVQWSVAHRLAERIGSATVESSQRILEIGCGTGLLSAQLVRAFPDSELLLTDIAPSMLNRCRARLGNYHRYQLLDGERPEELSGKFDLIVSSLAFQWFADLRGALNRLSRYLAPRGRMVFATLGYDTFSEWRQIHTDQGLSCGAHHYPSAADFPWPDGFSRRLHAEWVAQSHASGLDFVRSLKMIGAHEPVSGHQRLAPGALRRLLASLEGGFSVTYHILYGEIAR
jgi:malonyl-CoA O-methyltransferase